MVLFNLHGQRTSAFRLALLSKVVPNPSFPDPDFLVFLLAYRRHGRTLPLPDLFVE